MKTTQPSDASLVKQPRYNVMDFDDLLLSEIPLELLLPILPYLSVRCCIVDSETEVAWSFPYTEAESVRYDYDGTTFVGRLCDGTRLALDIFDPFEEPGSLRDINDAGSEIDPYADDGGFEDADPETTESSFRMDD